MMAQIKTALQVITILIALWLAQGCGWPPLPPQAWEEISKRQVSMRAVGMMGIEPQTGTVFCLLCWFSYDRDVGQGPKPPDHP